MNLRARLTTALILSVAMAAAQPGPAVGDGLPAGSGIDAAPVSSPGGEVEYVTRSLRHASLVEARERAGGELLGRVRLRGDYAVPIVAYDGSSSGLSADAGTLVLINPRRRFPRARTGFAILDAKRLRLRRRLRLRGDFSFDALSPDGSLMYLINYLSPRDQARYRVRVYDLRARRLLAKPVVDPREPPDEMNGIPITRTTSLDGRWAYTLYDGAEHPFVHALDTERRRAVCVDLHSLEKRRNGLANVGLAAGDGSALRVEAGGRALASIDTATFEVTIPAEQTVPQQTGVPWLLVVAAVSALVLAAGVRMVRKPVSPPKT